MPLTRRDFLISGSLSLAAGAFSPLVVGAEKTKPNTPVAAAQKMTPPAFPFRNSSTTSLLAMPVNAYAAPDANGKTAEAMTGRQD